jgi:dUTP pyrophosphatase
VKKLDKRAILPTRTHTDDAGLDLYAAVDVPYRPGEVFIVPTNVAVAIDKGYVGLMRDRSSVSKTGLKVTAGVVDAGYTGEMSVVLINLSGLHGCIKAGAKIAQFIIIPISLPNVVEVDNLEETERGCKGFGSSGA